MSSGTSLILEALENIGQDSQLKPANPKSIERGFRALNSLLQFWLSDDIDLGVVPLAAPGDELNEPVDTTQVIIDNLSLKLAPKYDNDGKRNVSDTLRDNARTGFATMSAIYRVIKIPKKKISSTTPLGAGNNRRLRFRDSNFVGRNATVGN